MTPFADIKLVTTRVSLSEAPPKSCKILLISSILTLSLLDDYNTSLDNSSTELSKIALIRIFVACYI
jgi:hypothetical protein